jgi:zinc protease
VTADEIASRKTNLVGSFQVALSTTDGLASTLLAAVERGYPLSWVDDYPAQIRALTDSADQPGDQDLSAAQEYGADPGWQPRRCQALTLRSIPIGNRPLSRLDILRFALRNW